jgi:hypothetical protein
MMLVVNTIDAYVRGVALAQLASRRGSADPDRVDHSFEAGLERILDGLPAPLGKPASDVP